MFQIVNGCTLAGVCSVRGGFQSLEDVYSFISKNTDIVLRWPIRYPMGVVRVEVGFNERYVRLWNASECHGYNLANKRYLMTLVSRRVIS